MKDNFSSQSDQYARYRPTYPAAFFDYLHSIVTHRQTAWDCGTGSGQIAFELAKIFEKVYATDISQAQIDNAAQADNIIYSVQPAEATDFKNELFDLVVIAQAIHWFDFDAFYTEVRRTTKPDGLLCVVGYGNVKISPAIDPFITNFYENVIGPYWDKERRYIDEGYQTIPFPFEEITAPSFTITLNWTLTHMIGYLNTWSAVKHFIRQNGYNPVEQLQLQLQQHWVDDEMKAVHFPLLLRIGRVKNL